jgi:hypothetical protein
MRYATMTHTVVVAAASQLPRRRLRGPQSAHTSANASASASASSKQQQQQQQHQHQQQHQQQQQQQEVAAGPAQVGGN